ncbi:MAG TPA: hypothetical protein IAD10_05950 [Candidatus Fimicola cottocaccae]|nr:hypothetical protein [Candidatus Fimicola cottocaccae]
MREFINVIVQLCIIAVLQTVVEAFFDDRKNYMKRIISVLCGGVSLYIVLSYIYYYVYKEIIHIMNSMIYW